MEIATPDGKRKQLLWGVTLAWVPFLFLVIPTAVGIYHAFRGMAHEKATGLAVIGAGLTEFFATFGLVMTFVFEVVAVFLLLRTIHGGRVGRTMVSAASLCCSVIMMAIVGLSAWLWWGAGP